MGKFDEIQIKILEPLREKEVVLHFSFYANTFPIAYHYSLLLNRNKKSKAKALELIKFHEWNNYFPSKSNTDVYQMLRRNSFVWLEPKRINLFYASDISFKDHTYQKFNPLKIIRDGIDLYKNDEHLKEIEFTSYNPRFVFLNNNLYTRSISDLNIDNKININSIEFKNYSNIKDKYTHLDYVLDRILVDGIRDINVYTDIENEAREILSYYKTDVNLKMNFFNKYDLNSLHFSDKNESKTLDIYFYGAPTSFHFLSKTERFIPLLLNEDLIPSNGIRTLSLLHYNKRKTEYILDIENVLQKYHNNLFEEALSRKGAESLNNIRLAYNKYARLIRHDSYFYSPQSFANCVALHHNYDIKYPNTQVYTDIDPKPILVEKKNIHIHYGSGKLAIGLVLPIINLSTTRLFIIQKNRNEWKNKINSGGKLITLSNDKSWQCNFALNSPIDFTPNPSNDLSFILFDSFSDVANLLSLATSISYSLNNQEEEKSFLEFIYTEIHFLNKNILLFPFENNPFTGLGKTSRTEILRRNDNIREIKVKADRICIDREIKFDNTVHVSCEEHLEVILNISENETNSLFNKNYKEKNQLIFADEDGRFSILSKRKQFLVNELHFILAVYGYDFLLSKGIHHWEKQYITIIQSALTSNPEYSISIETFIRLQIVRLIRMDEKSNFLQREYNLQESNPEMIYEHLLQYANVVKLRFNNSREDQISRIFNTSDISSIERKYVSIIEVIKLFVSNERNYIEAIPMLFAGTSLEYQKLIDDIKAKLNNIFVRSIANLTEIVQQKERERLEKLNEFSRYKNTIDILFGKS